MSDDKAKEASGQPEETSGQSQETKDQVSYDTHRKLLAEKKALQAKLAEAEAKERALEQSKLEQEGKVKELNEKLKVELEGFKKLAKDKDVKYGTKVLTQEIKSMAKSFGAAEEMLEDVVKLGDWSTVEITDDFEVKKDALKETMAMMQKSKPWLFKSTKAAPNDLPPNGKQQPLKYDPKSLKGLKFNDLEKLLAQKLANK